MNDRRISRPLKAERAKREKEAATQPLLPTMKKKAKKKTRSYRPKRRPGEWRALVAVFFLTMALSLGFYLKTEVGLVWERFNTPLIISGGRSKDQINFQPILDEVGELTKGLQGEYGFYVMRLSSGESYGLKKDEIFPAASLIKLPTILALYWEVEAGRMDLDVNYVLQKSDKVGGAGSLINQPDGLTHSYRELIRLMGQQSDNTAFKAVRNLLGDRKIKEAIQGVGMERSSLEENETTPAEIGLFFSQLYRGELVNQEHTEEFLNILTETVFEDRIPAGVPAEIRVAHKIGTEVGAFSDGEVVFAAKPFVLVVMTRGAKESEALAVLPEITRLVWEFEISR